MKHKFISLFVACVAWLFASTSQTSAQANPSKCVSKITERLEALGQTAEFDFLKAREIMKKFDFGTVQAAVSDPAKAAAFKRVVTSLSEFCELCGTSLSGKGMKGYTRLSGGIIRGNGTDFVADLKNVFGGSTFDGPGFNKVMEQLDGTGEWISQTAWKSPSGLVYDAAPVNRQGHRLTHLFTHTIDMERAGGQIHNIFSVERGELLPLIDRAWTNRPPVNPDDPGGFIIDMGTEVVGTRGEKKILIAINPEDGKFLSARPTP